jgi:predicted nucleic acid-binding Zn ribbon protein
MRGLDPALRQIIAGFRNSDTWDADLDLRLLQALWHRVAGASLARNTRPVEFAEGRLVVRVPDATWSEQLRAVRGMLLAKLNAPWPGPGIRELWFTHEDHSR